MVFIFDIDSTDTAVYEVRLSPYKMILIQPFDQQATEMITMLMDNQEASNTFVNKDLARTESRVNSLSMTSIPSEMQTFYFKSPKSVFKGICRPAIFKSPTQTWEKLSKCCAEIYLQEKKAWITVYNDETGMELLTATFSPTSKIVQHSSTRAQITMTHQGCMCLTLLRMSAEDMLKFAEMYASATHSAVKATHESHEWINQPLPLWTSQRFVYEKTKLSTHLKCISLKDEQVSCGPVDVYIEKSGPFQHFSTRLIIQSSINTSCTFFAAEFEKYTTRKDHDDNVTLRLFAGDQHVDFTLDCNQEFLGKLQDAKQKASEDYKAYLVAYPVVVPKQIVADAIKKGQFTFDYDIDIDFDVEEVVPIDQLNIRDLLTAEERQFKSEKQRIKRETRALCKQLQEYARRNAVMLADLEKRRSRGRKMSQLPSDGAVNQNKSASVV